MCGKNPAMLLGVLPIVSVVVIFAARMVELGTKRNTIAGKIRENLTLRLFLLAGFLMLGGGIAEYLLQKKPISWPIFVAGWVISLLSFAIRRRAIAALGRFWSLHVEIRENHQLVQDGPFRYVRHPAYSSMVMELIAVGVILQAWIALGAIALVFIPALIMRVHLEENALVEKFGEAYRRYQKTTPALFPYRITQSK
jgi:protein-S-isoprenylcysteine O-methyltransferase Ste14